MSLARKLLLAMFIVSLTGTAFGAGTFASFTATTTNAGSTFATGTIVLTDTVNSGNVCYSTGTTATGPGASTDTNANATCNAVIAQTATSPGAQATSTVAIKNDGNLNAASLTLSSTCTGGTAGGTYTGTGDPCTVIQQTIATSGGQCKFGKNASGVVSGSAITFPVIVGATTGFKLSVDGTATADATVGANTYNTGAALTTAIQTAITGAGLSATAMVGQDNILYISSNSTTNTASSITVADPSSGTSILGVTANKVGITTGTTHTGTNTGGCIADPVHTLSYFAARYTASGPLSLGSLASSVTNTYTVVANFPTAAGNSFQGRLATFTHTWTAQ